MSQNCLKCSVICEIKISISHKLPVLTGALQRVHIFLQTKKRLFFLNYSETWLDRKMNKPEFCLFRSTELVPRRFGLDRQFNKQTLSFIFVSNKYFETRISNILAEGYFIKFQFHNNKKTDISKVGGRKGNNYLRGCQLLFFKEL